MKNIIKDDKGYDCSKESHFSLKSYNNIVKIDYNFEFDINLKFLKEKKEYDWDQYQIFFKLEDQNLNIIYWGYTNLFKDGYNIRVGNKNE